MSNQILFVDTTHPALPLMLETMGFACQHYYGNDLEEFKLLISKAFGLIIRSKFGLNADILNAANELKFVGRVGAGMENIDVELADKKGIVLFNAPEGNRDAVAEHTLGMLLALNNRILIADREIRSGIWLREENRGVEIQGKTIALIGYGNMGSAIAKRLSGFGANVIAYDKYKSNFSDDFVKEVNMETVFQLADIVSLHIPQTDETKYLVNSDWINNFIKPIVLINTSRGKIVKTSHLIQALKQGNIVGACLDVLEFENSSFENVFKDNLSPDFEFLLHSDKVILTPHIAGWTHESNLKLATVLAEKIKTNFCNNC